jgi:hypothetical protein
MVKHSLPQVHPEASTGVFARHLLKNDGCSVFQTRPNPNRNESNGEHSWRLVFVADGLNWWRKHQCRTALKPLLIFSARGTRLEGGNRGVQKCDSVDPLSLVIKCLGEGGGYESGDSIVRTFTKQPSPPGDQVNTHTHTTQSNHQCNRGDDC